MRAGQPIVHGMPDVAGAAWFGALAEQVLGGHQLRAGEALAVLRSPDGALLDLVAAAGRVRRAYFGNRVKLNYLVNMKSGLCGEDCHYCSQRRGSQAGVLTYNWVSPEVAVAEAERAASRGVRRVCLVASGRGPTERDIARAVSTVGAIKDAHPELEICVCLGILEEGQAAALKAAGTYAYNHNLNTSASCYEQICSTHTFDDRVATVQKASKAGLSPCSGVIVGMGEDDEELVDVAFSLRRLSPDSVPVNFLMPFPGTPLEGRAELTPAKCLRVLAMFRFVFPRTEVRIAGGREMHLRSLQPLGLHIANSIFLGDYLTSEGAPGTADLKMIEDAGFVVDSPLAAPPVPGTASALAGVGRPVDRATRSLTSSPANRSPAPVVRRRGPGTSLPGNT